MSEQAKHTAAEYAASAEKYGIPKGPYHSHGVPTHIGSDMHQCDVFADAADPGSKLPLQALGSTKKQAKALALIAATLPDLLIERDRQAEQILRLREACENSASVFDIVVGTTEKITGATVVHAYAQCVQAAAKCRAALAEGGGK
jgi:hypothetical protein